MAGAGFPRLSKIAHILEIRIAGLIPSLPRYRTGPGIRSSSSITGTASSAISRIWITTSPRYAKRLSHCPRR